MKEKHRRRLVRLAACGVALAVALPLGGCGSSEEGPRKIAVIGQSDGIQFWDLVEQGAVEAGEELGYDVTYANAESITDIEGQIKLINDAIARDADVIVIAPNDPKELNEALRGAVEKDIKVLTIDATTTYEQSSSYIGTDNHSAGSIAGRKAYEYLAERAADGDLGKIGIISHSDSASSATERVAGFQESLVSAARSAGRMQDETQGGPPAGVGEGTQGGPPAGVGEDAQGGPPAGADEETQGGPPAGVGEDTQGGPPAGVGEDTQGGAPAEEGAEGQQGGTRGDPSSVQKVADIVTEATAVAIQRGESAGAIAQAISAAASQAGSQGLDAVAAARAVADQYIQGGGSTKNSDLVVDIQYCNSVTNTAKDQAYEMLRANPDIQLLFATNERSTIGVCEAVEAYKEVDPNRVIGVIGFNSNDSEINYLRSGTLTGTIVQNPYNMGYLGVYYGGQAAGGGNVSKNVDTGVAYVSAENLESDEIQLLLDPPKFIKKRGGGN